MAKINDGGPAFPRPACWYIEHDGPRMCEGPTPGMSLRDYFAAKIAGSGAARPPGQRPMGDEKGSIDTRRAWALEVWAMADAMLAARDDSDG